MIENGRYILKIGSAELVKITYVNIVSQNNKTPRATIKVVGCFVIHKPPLHLFCIGL